MKLLCQPPGKECKNVSVFSIFVSIKKSYLTDPSLAFHFEVKAVTIVFKVENVYHQVIRSNFNYAKIYASYKGHNLRDPLASLHFSINFNYFHTSVGSYLLAINTQMETRYRSFESA